MKLKVIAATAALALAPLAMNASANGERLDGCYVAQGGFATSTSIPLDPENPDASTPQNETEQIGNYEIVLFNKEAPTGPRRLVLSGPFKGKIVNQTSAGAPILDHVLGDYDLEGLILTKDDKAEFVGGSPTRLDVIEVLNPVAGTGRFAGLIREGSNITVSGTLDVVTGVNTFDVVNGQLCFGAVP